MAISDRKIGEWAQAVSSLPDKPEISPAALKAAFDANGNQIKTRLNGLIDDLQAPEAAAALGFAPTAGVPEDNVQEAIKSVQRQVVDTALGVLPDGSVGHAKLDQDLKDMLTDESTARQQADQFLQSDLTAEITARTQADQGLQQQIDLKCQIVMGTYTGNGNSTQTINLGFQPRAVLVAPKTGIFSQSSSMYGGLAVYGPLPGERMVASIAENGFTVYKDTYVESNATYSHFNPFTYIAFV